MYKRLSEKAIQIILVVIFFIFSCWLFDKSFGYNADTHSFRIARHQVGDFGLHLSLIRSFSWGNNFPPQSPYYPGKPLAYHYFIDFIVGLFERSGVRLDLALNGLSVIALTILLYEIYLLPQMIFKKNILLGLLSVVLFLFHSGLTFIDYFISKPFTLMLFKDLWLLPDYLHKGPFDDSIISIFFTLNVYLNQRHLIVGLAIQLFIFLCLLKYVTNKKKIRYRHLMALGLLLGLSSRVHTLAFVSSVLSLGMLFVFFKKVREAMIFFGSACIIFAFHAQAIIASTNSHRWFNPGFLALKPLTLSSFLTFWWFNLGYALITILYGMLKSNNIQRKVFLSFFILFIVGNVLQLSFRIDHNHALFNYFIIIANCYSAYAIMLLWKKKILVKAVAVVMFITLTASGIIDLMVIKNDYQLKVDDAPANAYMQWIKTSTDPYAIILGKQEILDPITLSGRYNYFGHNYYVSVMGYDYADRLQLAQMFFEVQDMSTLHQIKSEHIDYVAVPQGAVVDFPYQVHLDFLKEHLPVVYRDTSIVVFKL